MHPRLTEFVIPEYKQYGANLSWRFPEGEKPIIIFGQDETIKYQFLPVQVECLVHPGEADLHCP
jgi:hypothetical protein